MSISVPANIALEPGQRPRQRIEPLGFSVASIGLSARDQHTLQAVFTVSRNRRPMLEPFVFKPGQCADMFVVNADTPNGLNAWRAYRQAHPERAHTPVVFVGHNRPADLPGFFVPRPLLVTRMLALLERVVVGVLGYVSTPAFYGSKSPSGPGFKDGRRLRSEVRVLVVDNCLPIRVQLKRALDGIATKLDFAQTGEQALALVADNKYDVVFVDIALAGIDGYEVCERIKQVSDSDETSVVMVTGKSSPADRIRGERAGCDTYLIRPVRRPVLETVIADLLPGQAWPEIDDTMSKRNGQLTVKADVAVLESIPVRSGSSVSVVPSVASKRTAKS